MSIILLLLLLTRIVPAEYFGIYAHTYTLVVLFLPKKLATYDAEKTDLQAQVQLLQTSVRSKDKQLVDLRKQLQDSNLVAKNEMEKSGKKIFELEMANVQMRSFM